MKKYKSLIYRMWKISASKIILSAFVYILLCSFMFLPFLFEIIDGEQGEIARSFEKIMGSEQLLSPAEAFGNYFFFLIPIFVGVGLIFASGIIISDLKVGWNRYAITLPVTAGEKARTYLLLHFLFFVGFESITLVYGLVVGKLIHVNYIVGSFMNTFAVLMVIFLIGDAVINYIVVLLGEHKNIEQIVVAIGFILGAIVFCSFMSVGSKAMIDVRKLLIWGGSIRGMMISVCALSLGFAIAYFIMKKLYERKLP